MSHQTSFTEGLQKPMSQVIVRGFNPVKPGPSTIGSRLSELIRARKKLPTTHHYNPKSLPNQIQRCPQELQRLNPVKRKRNRQINNDTQHKGSKDGGKQRCGEVVVVDATASGPQNEHGRR